MKASQELENLIEDGGDEEGEMPAVIGAAFSTSDEGLDWVERWCQSGCVRDTEGDDNGAGGCTILLTALCGGTPDEWRRSPAHGGFICSAWTNRREDLHPRPPKPPPDQAELFAEPEPVAVDARTLLGRLIDDGYVRPTRATVTPETGDRL